MVIFVAVIAGFILLALAARGLIFSEIQSV
jgi:hypothetical protein